jgi:hypothetical protein
MALLKTGNVWFNASGSSRMEYQNDNVVRVIANAISVPLGTNANRPTAANGMIRFNVDQTELERVKDGVWDKVATNVTVEAAHTKANLAYTFAANSAFLVGNTAYAAANLAYTFAANNAFGVGNAAFASGNTTYTYAANNVMLVANLAYGNANSTYTYAANNVMLVANLAYGNANSTYTFAANTVRLIANSAYAAANSAVKNNETTLITKGYTTEVYSAGVKSAGTYTPDPTLGCFQYALNNGAHTLAPPSSNCSMTICYYNQASAGIITTSGFTMVTGDDFTTTNQSEFLCYITRTNNSGNNFSHLHVTALQ